MESEDDRRPVRATVAVPIALTVTFALFWGMQALVSVSGELTEGEPLSKVEFVRLKRDKPPETRERQKPKLEKPDRPPPPEMKMNRDFNPGESTTELAAIGDAPLELDAVTNVGAGGSDQDVQPLVRTLPQYPPRAAQRGIEGWVEVRFTVTPAGTVTNERVHASYPGSIFDQAALNAVRRWKYSPKIVNGVPVERADVLDRLDFILEDS